MPTLNQPLNDGEYNINQDYNWTWEDVAGATYYYVQFRLGTGNWVGGLVDDSFATLNFGSVGSWEFFVQAIDSSYSVIAVSETRTFTTVTSGGAAYSAPLGSQTRSVTRVNSETDMPLFQLRNEINQSQDELTFQSTIFEENVPATEYRPTEPLDDTNQDTNGIVIKGQKDLTPKLKHCEDCYWDSLLIDPEMYFMNEILGLGDYLLNESECCPNH